MIEAVSMIASALSAASENSGWENRMPPAREDRQSQAGLTDWIPDYELTH
jgi:hypothetical protein